MSIPSCTNGSTLSDPTVLIIDDHELVATALAMTLRSAGLQARRHIVRSREGVLLATATLSPGVVLLDLDLGRDADGTPIDGTALIEGLCRSGWRVLALSGTSDEARLGKALATGALAGIPKSAALPVLVAAIRRAAQGVEVMHPERRRRLIEAHLREQDRGRTLGRRLEKLSERERAVLERLAQGRRAQAIAEEFVVAVTTVRTQIRAVLAKLEVGSQLEAVTLLYEYERSARARFE
jgi:DNA-binding NarL/FixJ family response regulator